LLSLRNPTLLSFVLFYGADIYVAIRYSKLFAIVVGALYLVYCRYAARIAAPKPSPVRSNPIDAIRARTSWRAYTAEPPAESLRRLEALVKDDDLFTGPFTRSRIKIAIVSSKSAPKQKVGTYGFISGAKWYAVGTLKKDQSPLDFGYVFERLIIEATRLGIGTCWLGGSFSNTDLAACLTREGVSLEEGERIYCVTPLGICGDDTSMLRCMIKRTVSESEHRVSRKPLTALFFDTETGAPLDFTPLPPIFKEAAEAVQLAPSAVNLQPWRVARATFGGHVQWHFFSYRGSPYFETNDIGIATYHWSVVLDNAKVKGKWCVIGADIPKPPVAGATYHCTWVQL